MSPCSLPSPSHHHTLSPHLETDPFAGLRRVNVHAEGIVHWGSTALVNQLFDVAGWRGWRGGGRGWREGAGETKLAYLLMVLLARNWSLLVWRYSMLP